MIFCSLYSGSSGNSILVGSEESRVLIDAGLSGKKILEALDLIEENPKLIKGIFITHEHIDHIKGAGIISRKFDIPIYANELTWEAMEKNLGKINPKNIKIMEKRSLVNIDDLEIQAFNTPHDSISSMGYTVKADGKSASIVTDIGTFTEEIRQNIVDSEIILIEANHDVEMLKFGPYPYDLKRRVLSERGHLCNEDCGNAIVQIMEDNKFKNIILGHLSNTNNVPELAHKAVSNILEEEGLVLDKDLKLIVAQRNNPSNFIKI
ncbi:MAG: MBL fold metallo-hydrolase [Sarcina sp.]